MIHPSIKDYRSDRRKNYIEPHSTHPQFLGRNSLDVRWSKYFPKANVHKTNEIFEFEVELPGFNKEDIKITVDDYILKIKAVKEYDMDAESEFLLYETNKKMVERKFLLNKGIGHEKIEAEYDGEMLTIHFYDVPVEKERLHQKVAVV
jgi:HSP20 family protein